jgi:hypothetical protein
VEEFKKIKKYGIKIHDLLVASANFTSYQMDVYLPGNNVPPSNITNLNNSIKLYT